MLFRVFNRMKRIALILAVFALIFSLDCSFLEAWSCEEAFALCFLDYVYYMADFGVVYCGIGYIFCRKYMTH